MIKVTLPIVPPATTGATVYLNPQHIERIYLTGTPPDTTSVIVLTTGVPDVTVQESNEALIYSIQADNRAGA